MRHSRIVVTALALPLSACSTYGIQPVYGPNGIVKPAGTQYLSVNEKFLAAAQKAFEDDSPANAAAMDAVGRDLVEINCHEYYRIMGRNERTSRIARNLILPITTALNSLLALHDWTNDTGTKEHLLGLINIGSAATMSGLDLYDEHFLFKSQNIDSVRTMTMEELGLHRRDKPATQVSFSAAVLDLRHFENLCTPAHILVTARRRIEGTGTPPQNGESLTK
jgi:hypothetical protein